MASVISFMINSYLVLLINIRTLNVTPRKLESCIATPPSTCSFFDSFIQFIHLLVQAPLYYPTGTVQVLLLHCTRTYPVYVPMVKPNNKRCGNLINNNNSIIEERTEDGSQRDACGPERRNAAAQQPRACMVTSGTRHARWLW